MTYRYKTRIQLSLSTRNRAGYIYEKAHAQQQQQRRVTQTLHRTTIPLIAEKLENYIQKIYLITSIMPWYNISQTLVKSQQTFQRRFNVVFRLIWRRDVAQRQINVETTLRISAMNWTTLDNAEITLSFSTSILTTFGNVETTLQIWPFEKKLSLDTKTK